jgi:serine/threonine protein kinase
MHRDIKPSNIFLKFENDKCITKLGDFGISRYNLDSSELLGNTFMTYIIYI